MNLPNKLTVARCIMAPLFLVALLVAFPYHYAVALILFIAASLTDMMDGRIARSRNLITNLGKFLDPLADKMLTTAAYLGLMTVPLFGKWEVTSLCWALMLILTREFAVTSVRLLAAKDGVVIAASIAGKIKTVMQMVSIIYMLALMQFDAWFHGTLEGLCFALTVVGHVLVWIAVVLTVIAGVQYVWNCRHYFKES